MHPDFVSILRCPKSGSKLAWVSEGLLQSEHGHSYKVEEGIFHLLAPLSKDEAQEFQLRHEKEQTRAYYDDFGWVSGGQTYRDAERFVDMRPAAWSYTARCIGRVRRHIPNTGRFILDVASGPIPYQEYMAFHDGFAQRICVDLSLVALRVAKKKLGDRGVYILGDLTQLPLADECVDAGISFHTIYHIPEDEQERAFTELHRVLRPDAKVAVIYTWGYSPLTARLHRLLDALNVPAPNRNAPAGLYYHPHQKEWFLTKKWPFEYEIRAWRTLHSVALQRLGSSPALQGLYAVLYQLENLFPRFFGLYGQYPLIIIQRRKPQ